MQNIELTLTLTDLCQIFHIKPVSVYRWVKEAREGRSQFPLPINGTFGGKRKLLWDASAIRAFQSGNNPPAPKIETASARTKRNNAALDRLRSKGVNVAPKEEA